MTTRRGSTATSAVRGTARQLVLGVAVAASYVAAAHIGFRFAFLAEQVTTVWAPTGISMAALLLWGRKLWPAVWAGAFVANLGIALAKLAASIYTNSGSMMAESIHSFADSGNQVLLYLGIKQAEKPPDANHPLGY